MLYMPDIIEGALNIGYQIEGCSKHKQKAYAQEYTLLGMNEIGIDKADDCLCRIGL